MQTKEYLWRRVVLPTVQRPLATRLVPASCRAYATDRALLLVESRARRWGWGRADPPPVAPVEVVGDGSAPGERDGTGWLRMRCLGCGPAAQPHLRVVELRRCPSLRQAAWSAGRSGCAPGAGLNARGPWSGAVDAGVESWRMSEVLARVASADRASRSVIWAQVGVGVVGFLPIGRRGRSRC